MTRAGTKAPRSGSEGDCRSSCRGKWMDLNRAGAVCRYPAVQIQYKSAGRAAGIFTFLWSDPTLLV